MAIRRYWQRATLGDVDEVDARVDTLAAEVSGLDIEAFIETYMMEHPVSGSSTPPNAVTVGLFFVDPVNGNDNNNGLSWTSAVATIAKALVLASDRSQVAYINLSRGVHLVSATLIIPQAVKLHGFGSLISQETEIVYNGADDGSYVIRTAGNTSGNDFSRGQLEGFLVRTAPAKPGGGVYTNVNGIDARNMQNGAIISNIKVQNMPGKGIHASWSNSGVPAGAFPGWVTFERVWSTGCNVNWHIEGGFTSVLFLMCAGDISSNTTDVFILDPPTGGVMGSRAGNIVFIGFKTEDNGSPSGNGATANYFTINGDYGVSFNGCSAKRGVDSGTKPWINYTATPASFHTDPKQLPVTITNCHTSNISVAVRGPGSVDLLKPVSATGGQVFQIAHWTTASIPRFAKIQDGFIRPDSTSALGSVEKGGVDWIIGAGTWGISKNQAYTSAATANSCAVVETGLADADIEVPIGSVGANAQRVIFRYVDVDNYWYVNVGGSVFKRSGGSEQNMGSTSGVSWAGGDVMRVVVIGTVVHLFKNGQRARVPLTIDSTNQTATKHGLGSNSSVATRFDGFSVTPI